MMARFDRILDQSIRPDQSFKSEQGHGLLLFKPFAREICTIPALMRIRLSCLNPDPEN